MTGPRHEVRPGVAPGHIPALDGIRGVAVVGVVAHHLDLLTGGYLGVDAFFVLSGFLITGILLDEAVPSAREGWPIDLGRFWIRRAKRLLPALAALLVVVVIVERWLLDTGVDGDTLRSEVLASTFYVANWQAIGADVDYWATFAATSPLRHMWSLAIEEQFYVVWPVVVVVAAWWCRRSGRPLAPVVGAVAALGAVTSVAVAQWRYVPTDSLRVYYGTDTRVAAILFGAVAASYIRVRPGPSAVGRRRLGAFGLALLLPLALAWALLDGTSELLYRGGLVATGLATTVVVVAAVRAPDSVLARLLSVRALRAVGAISYGLYLWHWPVIVWLTPERTGLDGISLLVTRLAVSLIATLLSFHLLEQPIRRSSPTGRRTLRVAVPAIAVVVGFGWIAGTTARVAPQPEAGTSDTTPIPTVRERVPEAAPVPTDATVEPVRDVTSETGGGTPIERLLVLGDSGAYFLGPALARSATDSVVVQRGVVGCGLLTEGGGVTTDDGFLPDAPQCSDWPDRWIADVEAFRPTHVLIVFSWPGIGDRSIDGVDTHPCEPTFDRRYGEQLARAIDIAGATSAEVHVATNPYYVGPGAGPLMLERTACLNDVMTTITTSAPRAALVDLASWLCADGTCRLELDGVTLRPDGLHFDGPGADIAADWILGEMRGRDDLDGT